MDFGALPPEVNSGRIYAGPGSGPMLAAAAAWSQLAAEFGSAASACESVVAELTGHGWLGPSSESMASAAGPYAAWIRATAGQAEQTATQAASAASAFGEAYAAVVPPAVIAANRAELATLIAGNVLGQNSAAIAATEAQYGQMWGQDAAVMYGYAGRSAAAAAVTPFTAPPAITNPAGTSQAGTGGTQNQLSQLINAIPQALRGYSPTSGSPAPLADLTSLQSPAQEAPTPSSVLSYIETAAKTVLPANDTNISALYGMGQYARNLNTDLDIAAATGGKFGFGSGIQPPAAAVAAGVGDGNTVGKLTVPASWEATSPEIAMTAAASPDPTASAAAAAAPGVPVPGGLVADMSVAGLAGGAIAGGASRRRPGGYPHGRLERLVGELTGTREVRQWHTDPSRRKDLLAELAQQPGVHEVHFDADDQTRGG